MACVIDRVKAAYNATRLQPIKSWLDWIEGYGLCACGMSAMVLARNPAVLGRLIQAGVDERIVRKQYAHDIIDLAEKWFTNRQALQGFTAGFDGVGDSLDRPHAFRVWWKIGRDAARAVGADQRRF